MKISVIRFIVVAVMLFAAVSAFCEQKTHTVQKGETLYSISRQYGLSVNELRQLNGLSDTSILKIGQVLKVSAETETKKETTGTTAAPTSSSGKKTETQPVYEDYTVKAGDTLYSIARASEITVAELKKINNFDDSTVLKYGVVIKIPSKSNTAENTVASVVASTQSVTNEIEEVLLSVTDDPRKYDSNKKGNVNLDWPVKALEVTYVSGKISGVSITAAKNADVTAIKEGTVTYSGFYRGFGNVVFIKSASNYIYVYSGLGSVSVSLGASVKHGDKLGTVGTDSLSGKSQISLMVYKNGKVIDPAVAPRG